MALNGDEHGLAIDFQDELDEENKMENRFHATSTTTIPLKKSSSNPSTLFSSTTSQRSTSLPTTPLIKYGMAYTGISGGGGCPYLNNDNDEIEEEKSNTKTSDGNDKKYVDCYYHDYLQLDKILNANQPRSSEFLSEPSHDEHLFITIHQAYELWFKQVLYELDSCITYLGSDILDDRELLKIVSRLQRINKILKLLVEQFTILDTMTPMNFLDFRKYLKPASGFQSVQFRLLENKLGLRKDKRMRYNKQEYTKVLTKDHEELIKSQESNGHNNNNKSLFDVLQKWLERFPYLQSHDWSFWTEYKSAVNDYILEEKQLYLNNIHTLSDGDTEKQNKIELELDRAYQQHVNTFNCIFDEKKYAELRKEGKVRLSYTSLQAALMIMLYREEPVLQMPFRVLELSMEVDNMLTQWRNAHALMVHRMLGSKMGTGGSSGFHYLRTAAIHHKVFTDFFNLSTYMIPKSNLPQLPNSLKFFMNFPSSTNQMKRIPMQQKQNINRVRRGHYQFLKDIPPYPTIKTAQSISPKLFAQTLSSTDSQLFKNASLTNLLRDDYNHEKEKKKNKGGITILNNDNDGNTDDSV